MLISIALVLLAILLLINSLFRVSLTHRTWETPNGYWVCCIASLRVNVFLIRANNLIILVDTDLKRNRKLLVKRLKKYNVDKIDYLLLTHTHFDHAENAQFIQEQYGAKVIVHSYEADFLAAGVSPLSNGSFAVTRVLINLARFLKIKYPYQPCNADILVDSEYSIDDSYIQLIPTPGHTKGSVSVAIDGCILLAGDVISGIFKFSIFPPFANSKHEVINSWKTICSIGCSTIIPGHGTPLTLKKIQNTVETYAENYE